MLWSKTSFQYIFWCAAGKNERSIKFYLVERNSGKFFIPRSPVDNNFQIVFYNKIFWTLCTPLIKCNINYFFLYTIGTSTAITYFSLLKTSREIYWNFGLFSLIFTDFHCFFHWFFSYFVPVVFFHIPPSPPLTTLLLISRLTERVMTTNQSFSLE